MEIEFKELAALKIWTIHVNSGFCGIVVLKNENPWEPTYEIFEWTDPNEFTLYSTISGFIRPENYHGLKLMVKEMLSQ